MEGELSAHKYLITLSIGFLFLDFKHSETPCLFIMYMPSILIPILASTAAGLALLR